MDLNTNKLKLGLSTLIPITGLIQILRFTLETHAVSSKPHINQHREQFLAVSRLSSHRRSGLAEHNYIFSREISQALSKAQQSVCCFLFRSGEGGNTPPTSHCYDDGKDVAGEVRLGILGTGN